MCTYSQLSLAEKSLARKNFGENVNNLLYDFKNLKAMECDNNLNITTIRR